jgi:DNA-binding HxlR family transcriptional regulator
MWLSQRSCKLTLPTTRFSKKKCSRVSGATAAFENAVALLGDRWVLLILREFALRSPLSFTQLLEFIRGIATNILSGRLRTLVSEGVLAVTPSESDGRKFLYSLTPKGFDLGPVLAALELWGKRY